MTRVPESWALERAKKLLGKYGGEWLSGEVALAITDAVDAARTEACREAGRRADDLCDCHVPELDGAGQHSPVCAIFKNEEKTVAALWAVHDAVAALRGEEPKP